MLLQKHVRGEGCQIIISQSGIDGHQRTVADSCLPFLQLQTLQLSHFIEGQRLFSVLYLWNPEMQERVIVDTDELTGYCLIDDAPDTFQPSADSRL